MFICKIANTFQGLMNKTRALDFLAPLALRFYLAPVFWMAANNKWNPFDSNSSLQGTIDWFDQGLGLPIPEIMGYMAWGAEYFGAILLVLGLGVRWVSIPLMTTMIVAAVTVHWDKGWQAIHDLMSPFASNNAEEAIERLQIAKNILKEHGNYNWLTEHGNLIASNNGIEFATTYFIMLLALFFIGAGKFVSADYWIAKKFSNC